jgi:cation transport regulator ChaC
MSKKNFLSFGYGSNMPTLRTKERCPSARAIGIAALHGHELRWHKRSRDGSGKCDIIKSEKIGAVVWGVVFEIPLAEKAALDRAEGLGKGYVEQGFDLFVDDTEAKCVAYVATDIDPGLKPYDWYKELVLLGAQEHGINEEYIRGLRETEALRDLDEKRASQQWALVDRVRNDVAERLETTRGLAG